MAATKRVVDLSNVKERGNFRPKQKPEGDYRAKIVKADDHEPKDTSKPMGWVLTIQVEGDARSSYPYYLSPEAKQVWKLAGIARAAGLNVGNKRVNFDPNKLVGKAIGIALVDDEYEGRVKSSIDDVFPIGEVQGNADEGPDVEDDDDIELPDDDDTTVEAYGDDSEVEDDEEPEPEPQPVKTRTKASGPATRTRRKPAPEPEPEEDDDEEDEEEPPAPPVRKRSAPARRKPTPVVEEDDLDEIDLDDLDD